MLFLALFPVVSAVSIGDIRSKMYLLIDFGLDASGNLNDTSPEADSDLLLGGVIVGAQCAKIGSFGGYYNGGSSSINASDNIVKGFGTIGNYTICAWFNTSVTNVGVIGMQSNAETIYFFKSNQDGLNNLYGLSNSKALQYDDATHLDKAWHFACYTANRSTQNLSIYYDGEIVAHSAIYSDSPGSGAEGMRIGGRAAANFFTGCIDQVSAYMYPLSLEEMSFIYNLGSGRSLEEALDAPPSFDEVPHDDVYEYLKESIFIELNVTADAGLDAITVNDTHFYIDGTILKNLTLPRGIYALLISANDTLGQVTEISVRYAVVETPFISIIEVYTGAGAFSLDGNPILEYDYSRWAFNASISGSDMTNYSLTLYNSSDIIISSFTSPLSVNSSLLADFSQHPFNFSVIAYAIEGVISTDSRIFRINDTSFPVGTGFANQSLDNNTLYTWDVFLTDEYLWNFSLSCSNGHNFSVNALGAQEYRYNGSTVITKNTTCAFEFCDGHTSNNMPSLDIEKLGEHLIFDGFDLEFAGSTGLYYEKKKDRYSFCADVLPSQKTLSVHVSPLCIKAPNSIYKGHYVCGPYAVDFEGDYKVAASGNTVIIDISGKKTDTICFNSIVSLNCVSGIQRLDLSIPKQNLYDNDIIGNTHWFTSDLDTDSITGMLLWFFLLIILVIMVAWGEVTKIPAIFLGAGAYAIVISFALFASVSAIVGAIAFLFSLMIMFRGVLISNS